jgi:hypothetical protein
MECSHQGCETTFHYTCGAPPSRVVLHASDLARATGMRHGIFLELKENPNGTDVVISFCAQVMRPLGLTC